MIEEKDLENKMLEPEKKKPAKEQEEKPTNDVVVRMKPGRSVQLADGRHAGPGHGIKVSRSIA
jgi:hypothetical protein